MDLEVVTIGTELLLGFTVDTNGAELGQALAAIGATIVRRTAVADEAGAIRAAVGEALGRTGIVITTGGLGPTRDDLSKQVVADLYGWPLRFDEAIWQALVDRFRRMGRDPSPANRVQAEVPEGATVLTNRWGTAPALWLDGPPGLVIMLPGVPNEMRKLLQHEVVPRLGARGAAAAGRVVRSRLLRTTSIPESSLAQRIGDLEDGLQPLTLAYLPGVHGVDLRLTAWQVDSDQADRLLNAGAARLRELLGPLVYGEGDTDLATVLLDAMRARGLRLAVGESCTGGLLGVRVTAISGSSDVFAGSAVCYHNAAKATLLSVAPALLEAHGAVSQEVAAAMARGAASRFGVEVAIGLTGIAGPSGGTEAKPVGTVCFGWVVRDRLESARYVFLGNRREIRERAAQFALHRLWRLLVEHPVS
ncbi:MAG TPA: competence/damage-inducible protein A [Gemmatimonadales bacterium]